MLTEEVRALFEQAENTNEPEHKLELLQDAFDLSDDMLIDESKLSDKSYILHNIRKSYIRRLIVQLTWVEMRHVQIDVWFNYVMLLVLRVKPEVDSVLSDDPQLSESFWSFMRLWSKEILPLLENGFSKKAQLQ